MLLHDLLRASGTNFASFLRSSASRRANKASASAELLPCPVPYPWTQAEASKGSRRQVQRYRERRALEILVNLQVVALNFLSLDGRRKAPDACFGASLSSNQLAMVEGLMHRTRSMSRLVGNLSTGCGSKLNDVQSELISLESVVDSLRDVVYGSSKQSTTFPTSGAATSVVPTVASRVAFPNQLKDFDPTPFLSEPYLTAFRNPDALLKDHQVNAIPRAPLTSSRTELWHLCWRWDAVKRLSLVLESEVVEGHRCNLFCLEKPDGELRQIIDRRPRNSSEVSPPLDGPKMGHASVFLGIVIPKGGCLRGSVDDLRNFYHAFKVPESRALSTPVGPTWRADDFKGSSALVALKQRHQGMSISSSTKVVACFGGLSMGDHWAPAIAQLSHEAVLKACGALREEEHLRLGFPLPRAPLSHYSGVCIDDKLSLQVFPHHVPVNAPASQQAGRDLETCQQAEEAYNTVHLEVHQKKSLRRARMFKVWGAQFDGNQGLLSMDATKLISLIVVTARVAKSKICTERLLQKLLGLWAFAFQFRRPLFSLFQEVYRIGHPEGFPDSPFQLSREAQQELQLASSLGMVASTSLKAQVHPVVYGTDASPEGAGIVQCHVGPKLARELYRRTDTRGFHTRLLSEVGAYLHAQGLPSDEAEFVFQEEVRDTGVRDSSADPSDATIFPTANESSLDIGDDLKELWHQFCASAWRIRDLGMLGFRLDFLELYAGSAGMSKAMLAAGFSVGPPIELQEGWNLADESLFRLVLQMCAAGRVGLVWVGPPCTTYSLARHPRLRSSEQPWGIDPLDPETAAGNLHLHQGLAVFAVQMIVGNEALVATPWGAYSRKLPWWRLLSSLGYELRLDQCRYGTVFEKATALLCTSKNFAPLGRRCRCQHAHTRLQGALAAQAAAYPQALCEDVARVSATVAKIRAEALGQTQLGNSEGALGEAGDVRDHRGAQRFVSHLWSTHVAESLPWKVGRAYRFAKPNHINVLEGHAHKTLMHAAPMGCRLVVFQDSMVSLGASAKGRSSSKALNRVLRQSAALQIAKDLYPSGIHCPTWALRADDPSRRKKVRPPRLQLPRWLLELQAGQTESAQDKLDALSGTPRSWGRWLLFGGAALLAASADFNSFSSWTEANQPSAGPTRPRKGACNGGNSGNSRPPPSGLSRLAGGRRAGSLSAGGTFASGSHSGVNSGGGVRQEPLRAGSSSSGLCGDDQRLGAEVPLLEELPCWALATLDHLGKSLSKQSASADAAANLKSSRHHSLGLELDALCPLAVGRLLRFIATLRTHGLESERLLADFGNWVQRRDLLEADTGEKPDKGRAHAERPSRRALRRLFFEEVFASHGAKRAVMALHCQPFPDAPSKGP